ncbi:addiction module protein [Paramicrobacterium agarici]|uniref:addiction module protein n=1 Tax=Paramicrobacterium agarici TaxID=630514 RepID=UPI00114D556C|nr:addiction module protein [Microbacterium agarici]TQO22466.1 putative addiction module component [Microbacterium agarici]
MTSKLADYISAGYALTPDERLEAARMLRLSVDHDEDSSVEIEDAWRQALEARVDEIVHGKVVLVDAEETYALLTEELASRRQ